MDFFQWIHKKSARSLENNQTNKGNENCRHFVSVHER